MDFEKELDQRSGSKCELCESTVGLKSYVVSPKTGNSVEEYAHICEKCFDQIEHPEKTESNHWRCLNTSMWSEVPAVKVIAWRMLDRLKKEGWPNDLLETIFLDEETLAWAKNSVQDKNTEQEVLKHMDSNGTVLQEGDTIVLIKDLDVKGAGFTAKRGTAVRNISLDDDPGLIKGKVNGSQIFILTKFVKKSN